MPRNRTARLAVLGSAAQRPAPSSYSSRSGSVILRRSVVGVLVVLSLALITVFIRESAGGSLHGAQGVGATVLRPFESGAQRVARPFHDGYGYLAGLIHAKSENRQLRLQVEQLRQEVIQSGSALQENVRLRGLLDYRAPSGYPGGYDSVAAAALTMPPSEYDQQIVVAAGRSDGIRTDDPVVTGDGLVGHVVRVTPHTAQVMLLGDATSAVSVVDINTDATGLLQHGQGPGTLVLGLVSKAAPVHQGDEIVTAGSRSGKLPSIYPRGIPIGSVTSASQTDTDIYQQIQIAPLVDGAPPSVLVLVPKTRRPH